MTDLADEAEDGDDGIELFVEPPEDPMHGPDGSLDCMDGRYALVEYWLSKLGIDDVTGSAITFGEGCSLAILHPFTGEWLTPAQIAKKAGVGRPATVQ